MVMPPMIIRHVFLHVLYAYASTYYTLFFAVATPFLYLRRLAQFLVTHLRSLALCWYYCDPFAVRRLPITCLHHVYVAHSP